MGAAKKGQVTQHALARALTRLGAFAISPFHTRGTHFETQALLRQESAASRSSLGAAK